MLVSAGFIGLAWGSEPVAQNRLLRGELVTQTKQGKWLPASDLHNGEWLRSTQPNTTVQVHGATMRIDNGSSIKLSKKDGVQLQAKGGRIFVHLDKNSDCQIAMAKNTVRASQGEFILDADTNDLYVLDGDATIAETATTLKPIQSWLKPATQIALDGPDVRKRANNRRRFTQGEENKGKRIGEDLPPSPSQTPAYTPTASPSPVSTVQPTVTPTTAPSPTSTPTARCAACRGWACTISRTGGCAC